MRRVAYKSIRDFAAAAVMAAVVAFPLGSVAAIGNYFGPQSNAIGGPANRGLSLAIGVPSEPIQAGSRGLQILTELRNETDADIFLTTQAPSLERSYPFEVTIADANHAVVRTSRIFWGVRSNPRRSVQAASAAFAPAWVDGLAGLKPGSYFISVKTVSFFFDDAAREPVDVHSPWIEFHIVEKSSGDAAQR